MDVRDLTYYYNRFKFREDNYHNLTRYRIQEIMVVSTFYDAFIFEQDGGLSEKIADEYLRLNLTTPPRVTSVPTPEDALRLLDEQPFDLVLTVMRIGGMSPFDFADRVKEKHPDVPVVLLLNSPSDLSVVEEHPESRSAVDEIFLWNGDSQLFFAMIKLFEDLRNVEYDARRGLVRVILLIEDSVRYCSVFLPLLYAELVKQTQRLISEEVTEASRRLRMRMRPKILLVHDMEQATKAYRDFKDSLLCVISDVEFHQSGHLEPDAGARFLRSIQEDGCAVPLLLQSMDESNAARAREVNAFFLHKTSPFMLQELRDFIVTQLGFGDFVFRTPDGKEVARVSSMQGFVDYLRRLPEESLVFHASNDHFSAWLIAHGEVRFARKIKPAKVSDFASIEGLRKYLMDTFEEVERGKTRGRIVDFTAWQSPNREQVVRLAGGSLGGKGRGLAFLNALLYALDFKRRFREVDICIPATAIIGTDEFDSFLERNGITKEVVSLPDDQIQKTFLAGELSRELMDRLSGYLEKMNSPLAVRSSGLLEDSQARPFAGVYRTYMLPNCDPVLSHRVRDVASAVKLVFSSVFVKSAREYIEGVNYQIEEEKMAVILQEILGRRHGDFYYPEVSGVAQSYNFYPTSPMTHADGIAYVALGLGKSVVEGGRAFRFCPRFPTAELLAPEEMVGASQQEFYAVRMACDGARLGETEDITLAKLRLRHAESHGVLQTVGSVWDHEFDRLVEDFCLKGPRVVTFNSYLRYGRFPLATILDEFLNVGEKAMGVPVEVEFAASADMETAATTQPTFFLLQIRPLTVNSREVDVPLEELNEAQQPFVFTPEGLGNGAYDDLTDILYVDPATFDRTQTLAIREEIALLNRELKASDRQCVLVGPGRWGSRDRFLGVPVQWPDISQARVIVEVDLPDFRVEASQGTHFLHNVVAMNVGYLKVRHGSEAFVDWDWLHGVKEARRLQYSVHLALEQPISVRMDGRTGRAAVYPARLAESTEE